ncbi:MAG: methyltransferase domain-containing protein [Pirellulales bacterium]|nr:methyltransferase domain-containing protein [Pirellulales bacterium]
MSTHHRDHSASDARRPLLAIDIGGEGRHAHAWNVNTAGTKTIGRERGEPIPRLIVAHASRLPFAKASVDEVFLERTPLTRAALLEIARVVRVGGRVVLRHVPYDDRDRHALAIRLIPGAVTRGAATLGSQTVLETIICVAELLT